MLSAREARQSDALHTDYSRLTTQYSLLGSTAPIEGGTAHDLDPSSRSRAVRILGSTVPTSCQHEGSESRVVSSQSSATACTHTEASRAQHPTSNIQHPTSFTHPTSTAAGTSPAPAENLS